MMSSDTTSDRFLKGLTLGEPLGRGGMSRVRAAATADGRRVAVKFPRLDGDAGQAAGRALVHREFGFLSEISHPNVVNVLGLVRIPTGRDETVFGPGLVMEYLDGGDLVSMAGCPPRIWVPVAARIACAVGHLHRSGIVHRDLKPRNILLRSGDMPCLIDFALAARIGGPAARGGGTVPLGGGTAAYRRRAPTGEADVADDVYALAVLVYELWLGTLPFGRHPTLLNGEHRLNGERRLNRRHPRVFSELRPVPGVRGMRRLAEVLAGILNRREAALSAGIEPLRHALESVADALTRNRRLDGSSGDTLVGGTG